MAGIYLGSTPKRFPQVFIIIQLDSGNIYISMPMLFTLKDKRIKINMLMDVQEFRKEYFRHTKYNLEIQIPHLATLADHYRRRFSETQHWADCIKVQRKIKCDSQHCSISSAITICTCIVGTRSTGLFGEGAPFFCSTKNGVFEIKETTSWENH